MHNLHHPENSCGVLAGINKPVHIEHSVRAVRINEHIDDGQSFRVGIRGDVNWRANRRLATDCKLFGK